MQMSSLYIGSCHFKFFYFDYYAFNGVFSCISEVNLSKVNMEKEFSLMIMSKPNGVRNDFYYVINTLRLMFNQDRFVLISDKYSYLHMLRFVSHKLNFINIDTDLENFHKVLNNVLMSINEFKPLTKKEDEIVFLLKDGYTVNDIASYLSITNKTVYTHINRIMKKKGIRSLPVLISCIHSIL